MISKSLARRDCEVARYGRLPQTRALDKAVANGLVSQRLAALVTDEVGTALGNLQDASTAKNQNIQQ
jgi:hypothetical protein